MPNAETLAKKNEYMERLSALLQSCDTILIVHADHVGSNQMQQVRKALRGLATIIMGKNTMMRKCIRALVNEKPQLDKLLPLVKENIGFVFCTGDVSAIRSIIVSNKVPAPARVGVFAPCDVVVPAGPTGLDPSQTSFFQALNIATKINKGQIEIMSDVNLIRKGEKVGSSEVALLGKIDIKPFSYGLIIRNVYDDGAVYTPEVLDLTDDDILQKFFNGVANVAALSRAIGFPTLASLPHTIIDGFKNLLAVAFETEYSFKQAEAVKNRAAAAPAASAAAAPAASAAAAAPAKKEEEEELWEKNDVRRDPKITRDAAELYDAFFQFHEMRRVSGRLLGRAMGIPTFPLWSKICIGTRIKDYWDLTWNEDYMVISQKSLESLSDEELYDYANRRFLAPYDKELTREQLLERVNDYFTFLGAEFVENGKAPNILITSAYCLGYYNDPAYLVEDIAELEKDDFEHLASWPKDAFLRRLEFENGPLRDQVEAHTVKLLDERKAAVEAAKPKEEVKA
eukprot:GILI01000191.1.p1 GENE.GILI01000191.1~~GILI01000191.1.p1  ORF type:complete len:512 (-),score=222.25 GILI01000191.1:142-1677(-)